LPLTTTGHWASNRAFQCTTCAHPVSPSYSSLSILRRYASACISKKCTHIHTCWCASQTPTEIGRTSCCIQTLCLRGNSTGESMAAFWCLALHPGSWHAPHLRQRRCAGHWRNERTAEHMVALLQQQEARQQRRPACLQAAFKGAVRRYGVSTCKMVPEPLLSTYRWSEMPGTVLGV
jgi:hypothetical protein